MWIFQSYYTCPTIQLQFYIPTQNVSLDADTVDIMNLGYWLWKTMCFLGYPASTLRRRSRQSKRLSPLSSWVWFSLWTHVETSHPCTCKFGYRNVNRNHDLKSLRDWPGFHAGHVLIHIDSMTLTCDIDLVVSEISYMQLVFDPCSCGCMRV